MAKFTFKQEPRATGPARGASLGRGSDIKLGGKVVGSIIPPHWSDKHSDWKISLIVDDPVIGHGWKRVRLSRKFTSGEEARDWIKNNEQKIQNEFPLHPLEM